LELRDLANKCAIECITDASTKSVKASLELRDLANKCAIECITDFIIVYYTTICNSQVIHGREVYSSFWATQMEYVTLTLKQPEIPK